MKIQGTKIRGLKLYSSAATVEPDSYFNLVSLLLPGNGTNGAQNNTFLDSSTNNFTVTRNGNTTQGTFSPFSQTGWSNYFNGSSQLVITSTSAAFDISGDFTVECWILGNDIDGQVLAIEQNTSPEYAAVQVQLSSNVYILNISQTGSSWAISQNTGVTNPNNSWNHIAVTRSGTSVKMFLNGTSIFSTTVSGALYSSGARSIINGRFGSAYFTGYVSNFRFVNGAALYTSNFTPPTEPLTTTSQGATAAQVELLTCQSNRFIDSSDNNFTITVSGTPEVLAVAPFNPTAAYSAATVGGSGYFDGTGDSLTIPGNSAFDFGTGNFTAEAWVYPMGSPEMAVIDFWINGGGSYAVGQWQLTFFTSNTLSFVWASGSNTATRITSPSNSLPRNAWTHIAVTRTGNLFQIFTNGVLGASTTLTQAIGTTSSGRIGIQTVNNASPFTGYISGVRILKGTSLYTTSFVPPTAPLTAIADTQLLVNFTNGGIIDAAAKNVLETVGGAAISTAQSKWGGSSMYFDGSGDYLSMVETAILNFGSSDFTIEAWIYATATVGANRPIWSTGTNNNNWMSLFLHTTAGRPEFFIGSGGSTIVDIWPADVISTNTWYHLAVTRSGSTFRMFLNGTVIGSGTSATAVPDYTDNYRVGYGRWNGDTGVYAGYINDLRVTRGYARYTANFTPPTAAFPTQ